MEERERERERERESDALTETVNERRHVVRRLLFELNIGDGLTAQHAESVTGRTTAEDL
jgi:hypothetical protein